jgi:hemin uptake protein HemP
MAKFKLRPVVVEAITFQEFIEFGKNNGANIVNDMPWSFHYNSLPVTHENDECYLIPTTEGGCHHLFTPDDMLITEADGRIYPLKKDVFEKTYEKVQE